MELVLPLLILLASPQKVVLIYEAAQACDSILVAGDFNEWGKTPCRLTPDMYRLAWTGTLRLEPGLYSYFLLLDGKTPVTNPQAAESSPHEGAPTSLLVVTPTEYEMKDGKLGDGKISASGVSHVPTRDALPQSKPGIYQLEIRTRTHDVASVAAVVYQGIYQKSYPMGLAFSDPLYDHYRVKIAITPGEAAEYEFILNDISLTERLTKDGLKESVLGGKLFQLLPAHESDSKKP